MSEHQLNTENLSYSRNPVQQPLGHPGYPSGQPGYPLGQPGYPLGQPGYPPGQPGYPSRLQPGYPLGQPHPLRQPGYPSGQQGFPHGHPGLPPGPNQPPVILQQPGRTALVMHPNIGLSPEPFSTTCPACHRQVMTVRTREYGPRTHFCALVLCLFCCWPCAPVPYCLESCKDVKHHCPECRVLIGTYYKRM